MPWNPECYHKFQSERFEPFEDLLGLVKVRENLRVIDLGCGTGELTSRMADHLPASDVTGVDLSPEMLEKAARYARPGLGFELKSIQETDGEWDLVFSCAAIHWVDDHPALVPKLFSMVSPGGQIAVQLPSNDKHAAHLLLAKLAGEEPFREALGGWVRVSPVLSIAAYAELLYAHGGKEIKVFERVYPHILEDTGAMADWMSGAAMVPYLDRLPEEMHESFLTRYREQLRLRWPLGPVFYPFRRILFAATRSP